MSQGNLSLISVPFHGDTITCIETPDGEFVAIRPMCDRLQLNFSGQLQRLKADPDLWGVCVIHTPSAGGTQETNCIPRNRVAAWLFKIEVSRVKPEAQDALRLYQREAADVLDRHFRLRDEERAEEIRQLRGQLSHCHAHLRAALPKWGQIIALLETGTFGHAGIAARVGMTQDRFYAEQNGIARCGMLLPEGVADNSAPSWLKRIGDLERMLQYERDQRQAEARNMSLNAYRRAVQGGTLEAGDDQPSLFDGAADV